MHRNILVTGATGKQGQALIHALLRPVASALTASTEPNDHEYHIYALTRNVSNPVAKHLAETEQNVKVVGGDLDDQESVTKIFEDAKSDGGIWGVFAVLAYPGLGAEADGEERQGKLLADLAFEYRVQCFIYSSAFRSGPKYEDELKLSGRAKANVEKHVEALGEKGLPWTILRPGFFMENFDGFIGSIAASVLTSGLKKDTTISLIASEDIGKVAAAVLRNPEQYRSKALAVVGEYATMTQIERAHRSATGKPMPAVPAVAGKILTKINTATQSLIQDLERNHHARTAGEYPAHVDQTELARSACKIKTYEEWRAQVSKKQEGGGNWNQVSFWKLFTGKS